MAGPNDMAIFRLPSAKHTNNYGKSPFLMGKSTISMAIFNSYVKLPEGKNHWTFERANWCAQKRGESPESNVTICALHCPTRGTSSWMVSVLMLCDVTYEIKTSLTLGSRAWQRCWENFPPCHLASLGITWPTFRDEVVPEPTYFDSQNQDESCFIRFPYRII